MSVMNFLYMVWLLLLIGDEKKYHSLDSKAELKLTIGMPIMLWGIYIKLSDHVMVLCFF